MSPQAQRPDLPCRTLRRRWRRHARATAARGGVVAGAIVAAVAGGGAGGGAPAPLAGAVARPASLAAPAGVAPIAPVAVGGARAAAQPAPAPDLFDQTRVRQLFVQFTDADWREQLDRAGESQLVRADLTVDGVTLPGVGLRYKGLSSSRVTGPKKPFNLSFDAFAPGQRLYGYDTVNLNNSYADPSYLREVLTNDLLRPLLPTPRMAFAELHLNGTYWGLYILSEQIEGTFVDAWFRGGGGLLVKADSPTFGEQVPRADAAAAAVPAGALQGRPGFGHQSNLTWRGEDLVPYKQNYEVKTPGVGDPGYMGLRELIRQLDAPVANGGLSDAAFEAGLPLILDVDTALWYLAATNAVMNYDSYYFGHNYYLHRTAAGHRWVPLLWDTSLSYGVFNLAGGGKNGLIRTSPFIQSTDPARPLVRRLLAVPRWRADYLAHFRTVRRAALDAATVEARGRTLQDLIRPALTADRNRLYALDLFEKNLLEDVSLGQGAIIINDGNIPGIVPLVRARAEWLDSQADLAAPDHALAEHVRTPDRPVDGDAPRVTVRFTGADAPVAVEVVVRIDGKAPEARPMTGGAEGWTADLPALPAGARVAYYVHAAFADGRTAFHPEANWTQPWDYRVTAPPLPDEPNSALVINEIQADNVATLADEAGEYDDWVEIVNRGRVPIELGGYTLGPSAAQPWAFALPSGTLHPGERLLVWCDEDLRQGPLHAPFKLSKAGDGVVLATRVSIVDRVTFGPQTPDHSHARVPDATGAWHDCASPSPRTANACAGLPEPTAEAPPTAAPTDAPPPTATATAPPTAAPTATAGGRAYLPWGVR